MRAFILTTLLAASLTHVADSAAPRRSLTVDVFPAGPRSEPGVCWESLLALCLCKHDLLASFLTGSPVPRACCRAAADVDVDCGSFTRAFVGSLLPGEVLLQWAASTGARPNARAPPRVPFAAVASPRVSGGARPPPPPEPEAYTSVRSGPPPRVTNVSGGTRRAPPKRKAHADLPEPNFPPRSPAAPYEKSFYLPPPYPEQRASGGTRTTTSPEAHTRVRRPPPPRARKARADLPEPNFPPPSPAAPYEMSFYLPPPYPEQRAFGGTETTPPSVRRPPPPSAPKAANNGTHDAVVAGAREPQVRGAPPAAVPVHGGASGSEVATAPPRGARTASPIPQNLPDGTGTPF